MNEHDPRALEWQRRYEQNDTPWDKGAPAPALVHFLRRGLIAGRVLVPGSGRGHEVRAIAAQPGCSVVGLDLAPSATAEARQLAQKKAPGLKAEFITADFLDLPPELRDSFDWLVEHTCFCALEPALRPDYVRAAASALRKGGKIFGIFYLNPDVETGPPFAISKEGLAALFDPYFMLVEEAPPAESFPGRENREWIRLLQKR
jgi:SAM-dependent methyltransferase